MPTSTHQAKSLRPSACSGACALRLAHATHCQRAHWARTTPSNGAHDYLPPGVHARAGTEHGERHEEGGDHEPEALDREQRPAFGRHAERDREAHRHEHALHGAEQSPGDDGQPGEEDEERQLREVDRRDAVGVGVLDGAPVAGRVRSEASCGCRPRPRREARPRARRAAPPESSAPGLLGARGRTDRRASTRGRSEERESAAGGKPEQSRATVRWPPRKEHERGEQSDPSGRVSHASPAADAGAEEAPALGEPEAARRGAGRATLADGSKEERERKDREVEHRPPRPSSPRRGAQAGRAARTPRDRRRARSGRRPARSARTARGRAARRAAGTAGRRRRPPPPSRRSRPRRSGGTRRCPSGPTSTRDPASRVNSVGPSGRRRDGGSARRSGTRERRPTRSPPGSTGRRREYGRWRHATSPRRGGKPGRRRAAARRGADGRAPPALPRRAGETRRRSRSRRARTAAT